MAEKAEPQSVSIPQQIVLARTLKAFGWGVTPSPEAGEFLQRQKAEDEARKAQKKRSKTPPYRPRTQPVRREAVPERQNAREASDIAPTSPLTKAQREARQRALDEKNAAIMRERQINDAKRFRRRSTRK